MARHERRPDGAPERRTAERAGQVRHIWLALAFLVLLAVAGGYLSGSINREMAEDVIERHNAQQMLHAERAARGIEEFFQALQGDLRLLAGNRHIVTLDDEGKEMLRLLATFQGENLVSISRFDETGRLVHTEPMRPEVMGMDFSFRRHVRELIETQRPVASGVIDPVVGGRGIAYHYPVFAGDRFTGSVGLVVSFDSLAHRFLGGIRMGSSYAWMVGSKGIFLYHPRTELVARWAYQEAEGFPRLQRLLDRMVAGDKGVAVYDYYRQSGDLREPVVKHTAYAPARIGNALLSIAVTTDEPEILAGLHSVRTKMAWAGFLLAASAVIVLFSFFRTTVIFQEERKRREVEAARRDSEQRYRVLFESAGEGIFLLRDGRHIDANQTTLEMFGCTAEQFLGTRPQDFSPPFQADGRSSSAGEGKRLAAALDGTPQLFDWTHRRLDGTEFQAEVGLTRLDSQGVPLILAIVRDVTGRKRMEAALRESEEKYRSIYENAVEGFYRTTPGTGRFISLNPAMARILGYSSPEEAMACIADVRTEVYVNPQERDDYMRELQERGVVTGLETQFRRRDGTVIWVSKNATAICDDQGRFICSEGVCEDITARKRAEAQLQHLAFHDSLTGLPNRVLLLDHLGQALERAKRRPGYIYAVLFVDLDRFKTVNDSLGHMAGDELIREAARRLKANVRDLDTVARLGGDEFVVLLEEAASPRDVIRTVKRLRRAIAEPIQIEGREVVITASLGILLDPGRDSQTEDLIRFANIAMHHAKEAGKNQFKVFKRRMLARAQRLLDTESELRRGLAGGEFFLQYQPIFCLATGRLAAFEALIRWNHPERGLVPPDDFIPVAEDTGLIKEVGEWALRQACRQSAAWAAALEAHPPVMCVNVSGKQFAQADLADRIERILRETGADPTALKLEITESVLMDMGEQGESLLGRLKRLGMGLSIDDFGTGYSSLSYLQRFPVDTIKIDRCFIGGSGPGQGNREIVRAIVSLSRNLGKDLVAEGIETEEQADFLRGLGCECGQGYLFSRPLDPEAAWDILDKHYRRAA